MEWLWIEPNITGLIFVPVLQRRGCLYVVIVILPSQMINVGSMPRTLQQWLLQENCSIFAKCVFVARKMLFSGAIRKSLIYAFLVPSWPLQRSRIYISSSSDWLVRKHHGLACNFLEHQLQFLLFQILQQSLKLYETLFSL